jgi:hypothetical protein
MDTLLPLEAYEGIVLRQLLRNYVAGIPIHPLDIRIATQLSERCFLCVDCYSQHEGNCDDSNRPK